MTNDGGQRIIDGLDDCIAYIRGDTAAADMVTIEWPRCATGNPCGTDTVAAGRSCAGHTDGKCRHLSWLDGRRSAALDDLARIDAELL